MPRASYKKWRSVQDFGIRPGLVLPAWKEGDRVEVIGTGVRGTITRCTTLDWSRWEVLISCACDLLRKPPTTLTEAEIRAGHALALCKPKFVETHANNLRAVLA